MKDEKWGEAPLESEGSPERYFPVNTPRPSGDQDRTPTPNSLDAGKISPSILLLSSEYSF